MNINVRIEITPGTARRVACVALTLLVGGIAAIAYAVPVTFESRQKLTAAQLNQNFGDLEGRVVALSRSIDSKAEKSMVPVVTEWRRYEPELRTNRKVAVREQTTTGYYRRVGDSIEAVTFSAFTAAPNSGATKWLCSLPDGLMMDLEKIGGAGIMTLGGGLAQGVTNVTLGTYAASATEVSAVASGTASYQINDHSPFDFGNQSSLSLYFTAPIVGWGTGL